jgi:hypothetical protein
MSETHSAFDAKFPIDKLKAYERNPRKISERAIEVVKKSVRKIRGYGDVLLAHDEKFCPKCKTWIEFNRIRPLPKLSIKDYEMTYKKHK